MTLSIELSIDFITMDVHYGGMLVTSWNVNSLRVRLPQVLDYLQQHKPDILTLQETKMQDQHFPCAIIKKAGYHVVFAGQPSYNGVAILSRLPATNVLIGMSSSPIIDVNSNSNSNNNDKQQQRLITATIGNIRLMNAYVPNGNSIGSDKYDYKMRWITAWHAFIATQKTEQMGMPLIIVGDFNIAPADIDVHDHRIWHEQIMCSTEERILFASMLDSDSGNSIDSMIDVVRQCNSESCFSWWDYRSQAYKRGKGLRIDHILASTNLVCRDAGTHAYVRGEQRPSDHCPVWALFS